jgi:hypothetical protein
MDIMERKWTYGLWGAAAGAVGFWIITAGITGWLVTGSTAARQSEAAVSAALLPICADAIMADPAAAAELKTKRPADYDDVVRDHLKTVGNLTSLDYVFRRACGKLIEERLAKQASQ